MEKLVSRKTNLTVSIFVSVLLFVTICLFGCAKAPTTTQPTPAQVITWRGGTLMASSGVYPASYQDSWASDIEKKTGGRLKIVWYYSGALGFPAAGYLDATRKGLAEFGGFFAPFASGEDPVFTLDGIPMLISSLDDAIVIQREVMTPLFDARLREKWNSFILVGYVWPNFSIFSNKKITKMEDFKGVKVRCMGKSDNLAMKALGALPVSLSTTDIYPSLQRGIVDAVITSCCSASELHLAEVCKYANRIPVTYLTCYTMVNKDAFNSLPKDIQEIVLDSSKASTALMRSDVKKVDKQLYDQLRKDGMEEVIPSTEFLSEITQKVAFLKDSVIASCETVGEGDLARKCIDDIQKRTR